MTTSAESSNPDAAPALAPAASTCPPALWTAAALPASPDGWGASSSVKSSWMMLSLSSEGPSSSSSRVMTIVCGDVGVGWIGLVWMDWIGLVLWWRVAMIAGAWCSLLERVPQSVSAPSQPHLSPPRLTGELLPLALPPPPLASVPPARRCSFLAPSSSLEADGTSSR